MEEQISISFTLTADEVRRGLYQANILKSHVNRSILQNILVLIGLALFIGNIFAQPKNFGNYLFVGICVFLMVFVWVYPAKRQKRIIEKFRDLGVFSITLNEKELTYCINADQEGNVIPLDRSIEMIQDNKLFLLKVSNNFVLIIPKRSFSGPDLQRAEKYLRYGTTQVNSKY